MSLFKQDNGITLVKEWNQYSKFVTTATDFTDTGNKLPFRFYKANDGNSTCPIVVREGKVEAFFTTNDNIVSEAFDKNVDTKKVKKLADGEYLYDFKLNEVVYFIDTCVIVDKDAWIIAPPSYDENNFSHLIAIDRDGKLFKIYNTTNNFCPALFIGHVINMTFPEGDYTVNTAGAKIVFDLFLNQYGYGNILDRVVTTFCSNGFNPKGKALPTYDLNPDFIEQVYDMEDENEKAKKDIVAYNQGNLHDVWDERFNPHYARNYYDDELIYLSDLIGEDHYPKVYTETLVVRDVHFNGLTKLQLNPLGDAYLYYDGKVTSEEDLDSNLVLPEPIYYIDISKLNA